CCLHPQITADWLMKYGYLPPSDPSTGQLQAWTAVTDAIKTMQMFAGLKDTGVLDEETLTLMNSPRCSLPDQDGASKLLSLQQGRRSRRKRRAASTWSHHNINWRLRSYPSSSHLPRETIRSLVFYALRVWAEPTPLEFHEVGNPEAADLQVDFLHGHHGDSYPFDGAGGAVGHAFFPSDPARAGGVHLDAEEQWVFRQPGKAGTDLFTVLVHEFGHALGLAHSSSRHSVMRPYYHGPVGDPLHYRLGQQDLEHIIQLYGKAQGQEHRGTKSDRPNTQTHPLFSPSPPVDRCNTSFDAVAKIRGETFFFKGLTVWRVTSGGLVSRRGASVRRLWRGLPPDLPRLDAVLERHSDHAIIFISGSQFWLFRDLALQEGYPKPLTALHMGGADETGSGRRGLVWDPEEGPVWGTVGDGQEDEWSSIYFFKGDSYWRFLSPGSTAQEGYPRSSAADWLDCADHQSPSEVDDFSLSLSPPAGRPELQETRRKELQEEDPGGSRRDRHQPKYRQDGGSYGWTQCSCQNKALAGSKTSLSLLSVLVVQALLAV
uniref:Matrix metallopeptidase 17b n=1 Tax=Cyprinodon variegatus TaxID=28743 RepID=A0A3Q2DKB4_CYPVA